MLIFQLITTNYPYLKPTDEVALAFRMMDENHTEQLPVVDENQKYLGLVNKDDLLQVAYDATISALSDKWEAIALLPNDHLVVALKMLLLHNTSLLAVINDRGEWLGAVTLPAIMRACGKFIGVNEPGGIITFETDKKNLSFSEIARLVETNDAYITQLNTQTNLETGLIEVCIKINKSEISTIVATLQRYDYNIKHYSGEENFENELKENYDLLMAYLNI